MPQTRSTAAEAGLTPAPIGIFLPTPHRRRSGESIGASAPAAYADWCGVAPNDLAHLIAAYTRPGDLVLDLDQHPTVTQAARYLGREPTHLNAGGDRHRPRPAAPARRLPDHRPRAGLILASLPRAGADSGDLHAMTRAMHTWRTLLRPGGYLLTALIAHCRVDGRVSHRATVIAAACTAGLTWQQEFLVLRVPLPEYEPRAMPNTAGTTPAALVDRRHQPIHVTLLAFQHQTVGNDA